MFGTSRLGHQDEYGIWGLKFRPLCAAAFPLLYCRMRPIWSGLLSFGLVNIPVKLYSASEERKLKFRLLEKHELSPIRYARISQATSKEVKYEDIVRGYEYQKGDFVILDDEDFQKASPKKTKTIEIISFAEEQEIKPQYFKAPYYIEPGKNTEKAYVLLREALKRAGKVGVAQFVLKEREHVGIVKPEEDALILVELRYEDELRDPGGLNFPKTATFSPKELDVAMLLIKQLEQPFEPSNFHDTYTEELEKIISKKAEGHPVHVEEGAPATTDMKDLMEILKKSIENVKTPAKKSAAHRVPHKAGV